MTQKVALITGSGKQRIGWHVAHALGLIGYHLCIHYRTSALEAKQSAALLNKAGIEATIFQADLARESDVEKMPDKKQIKQQLKKKNLKKIFQI